jgi:hypothetical protein
MSANSIETLKKYFSIPYGGHVFIFTNKITLEDIQQHTFTEILSHKNAVDANGKLGYSVAMAVFEAIKEHSDGLQGKKVLDIGGNTGYFSFLAVENGAEGTMVEKQEKQANVAKAIAEIRKLNVKIFNGLIQDYLVASTEIFDCVFMLNMFDQMLRTDEETAWKTLRQVSERCKMLFFMNGPTEQIPNTKGLATSTPIKPNPASNIFSDPDFKVIICLTKYKNHKILLENGYENRQLQVYW